MKRLISALVSCFLLLLSGNISPVLAGGGSVALNPVENPHQWFNVKTRMVTLFVNLSPHLPCEGARVTFDYESKEDGDSVNTGTSNSNIYTIPHSSIRFVNGKALYSCQAIGTYLSINKKLKTASVTVATSDGQTESRIAALNFQTEYPSGNYSFSLPWDNNPSILNFSPKSAKSLGVVVINGSNFGAFNKNQDFVIFNPENSPTWKSGPQATILNWTDQNIAIQVPYLPSRGIYRLMVGNSIDLSNSINIEITSAQPSITNITPATLSQNSVITIQGTEFGVSGGRVAIHNPASYQLVTICKETSWNMSEIKCKIPINLNPNSEYAIQVYSRDNIPSQYKYLFNGQITDCSPHNGCG